MRVQTSTLGVAVAGDAAGLMCAGMASSSSPHTLEFSHNYGHTLSLSMGLGATAVTVSSLPVFRFQDTYLKRMSHHLVMSGLSTRVLEETRARMRTFNLVPSAMVIGLLGLSVGALQSHYPEFAILFSAAAITGATGLTMGERIFSDWVASKAQPVADKDKLERKLSELQPTIDSQKKSLAQLESKWIGSRRYPSPDIEEKLESIRFAIESYEGQIEDLKNVHLDVLMRSRLQSLIERLETTGKLLDEADCSVSQRLEIQQQKKEIRGSQSSGGETS